MNLIQTVHANGIVFRAAQQRVRSIEVGALAQVFERSVTKPKPNSIWCKTIIKIVTFIIRTLKTQ